jgi:threonine synthase
MLYRSTRSISNNEPLSFRKILMAGLAPDGGLYVPVSIPKLDLKKLERMRSTYEGDKERGYAKLAYQIMSLFADDIMAGDLSAICEKTYQAKVFGTTAIAPLTKLGDSNLYLGGLSNGPTLAFKDMAMQLLGNLFEFELTLSDSKLNIFGATSGDTGSAAEYALRGKNGVRVFMTSPKDRMSAFQQAQMYSLQDENIHNIVIDGTFDDCQDLVKKISSNLEFKNKYAIGAVNSINWARIAAQVVYYFALYFQATKDNTEVVSFTVPSGNFGNAYAAHIAREMGLPISRIIVATNENDVLHEFFTSGRYEVRNKANTHVTSSPSMDISKASNFERFIFNLFENDGRRTQFLFGERLEKKGFFDLSGDPNFSQISSKYGFLSGSSSHQERLDAIRYTYVRFGVIVDTHTADGIHVARKLSVSGEKMIVLETASPIKFPETIFEAIGIYPERPHHLVDIESLKKRVSYLPTDANEVMKFIASHCQ